MKSRKEILASFNVELFKPIIYNYSKQHKYSQAPMLENVWNCFYSDVKQVLNTQTEIPNNKDVDIDLNHSLNVYLRINHNKTNKIVYGYKISLRRFYIDLLLKLWINDEVNIYPEDLGFIICLLEKTKTDIKEKEQEIFVNKWLNKVISVLFSKSEPFFVGVEFTQTYYYLLNSLWNEFEEHIIFTDTDVIYVDEYLIDKVEEKVKTWNLPYNVSEKEGFKFFNERKYVQWNLSDYYIIKSRINPTDDLSDVYADIRRLKIGDIIKSQN